VTKSPDGTTDARGGKLLPWRFVSDTVEHGTNVFSTVSRKLVSPKDGLEKTFSVIATDDWVNVVAITPDRKIVFVRQWRCGSGSFTLELPGGRLEKGDDFESAGTRELMEETGYSVRNVETLLTMEPNPALFSNRIATLVGTDARKTGETNFDENEDLEVVLLSIPEVKDIYLSGKFTHALVVGAVGYFLATRGHF
jgi:8-oxo-dGTP pyrophosphatase MutT (NUDIX family)